MYQHFLQHYDISCPTFIRSSDRLKGKTSETLEGSCSVTSVSGLCRTDTEKDEVKNSSCSVGLIGKDEVKNVFSHM
jgi:hypothetical protein